MGAPLTIRQLHALLAAVVRELLWGLAAVAREVRGWRTRARSIPDAAMRKDALRSLANKRGHTDGAALFCILTPARNRSLLCLLVAYELIWDYLDTINEHSAHAGLHNGLQLHRALIDALAPNRTLDEYYLHHTGQDDGGYLYALTESCRMNTARLPAFARVRSLLMREAARVEVLAINHELEPVRRDRALRAWAARENEGCDAPWYELSGAASASLTIHVLLALAAQSEPSLIDIARAQKVYFPWVSALTTMVDSYVDQAEDRANGDHSYIAHYPSPQAAGARLNALLRLCMREVAELRSPERHRLLIACMTAMYLSKDSARVPQFRDTTRSLARAGGSLTRLLMPILRAWRIVYAQRGRT